MHEGEQGRIAGAVDLEVVEPALPRSDPLGAHRSGGEVRPLVQQVQAAAAEQLGVTLLVLGVEQEQPPQQGVLGQLGGADQVAAAVGLGLGEAQQVARPQRVAAPDPGLQGPQGEPEDVHRPGPPNPWVYFFANSVSITSFTSSLTWPR